MLPLKVGWCSKWDGYTSTGHLRSKPFTVSIEILCSLGTVFLWMFWPSFNSVLVDNRTPGTKLAAICSTYLALAVSAVTAAAVSVLSSPKGKLHPVGYDTWFVNTTLYSIMNRVIYGLEWKDSYLLPWKPPRISNQSVQLVAWHMI